jgi:hypothetical protein
MDIQYFLEGHLDLLADIKGEIIGLRSDVTRLTEALAGIRAEATAPAAAVIAKAQEAAKAAPTPAQPEPQQTELIPAAAVDPAELVKLAAAKSQSVGKEAVKAAIAKYAPSIKDVPLEQLPALQAELVALA